MKWRRTGAVAMMLVSLAGCAAFRLPAGSAPYAEEAPPPGGQLVGVSMSGGGNRSALYASYVLELLASLPVDAPPERAGPPAATMSFADRIGYVSSVSGGSFASAWFALGGTRPAGGFAQMTGDLPTPDYDAYFDAFHNAMNTNWEVQLLFGVHASPTQWNNASRLAGAIDSVFLHRQTMADVDRLEHAGASPYLVFNATDYDSGRRFVMTTLPTRAFCIDVADILARVARGEQDVKAIASRVKCGTDILTPTGFDSVSLSDGSAASVDSSTLAVSRIVATSGAFPAVVGPIAYNVEGHDALLHLIDGGLTDNSGVESLAQLFLSKLIHQPDVARTGLIVEIDASLPFDTTGANIARDTSPAGALIDDVTRPSDIQEVRASYYRHDLWVLAQQRVGADPTRSDHAPDRANPVYRLKIFKLQHTEFLKKAANEALANPAGDDLVALTHPIHIDGCDDGDAGWDAATAHAKVAQVPTRYNLSNHQCAASMMRLAACWSVHLHAAEIQHALADDSPSSLTPTSAATRAGAIPAARIHRLCHELEDAGAF